MLFADVAGYAALAEKIVPEDMHAVMDRCFQLILEHVHRYEGTLARGMPEKALPLLEAQIEGGRRRGARKIEARGLEILGRALADPLAALR